MAFRRDLAISLLAAAAFAFSGCTGVGSVMDGTDENIDPDTVGTSCEAELGVTGTFQPTGTGVSEDGDCLPMGTWTLNVTVADAGECEDVPVTGEYVYTVTEDDDGYLVTYPADPDNGNITGKITIEGPCQGSLEHWSDDGMEYTLLKPYTMDDFTLAGVGAYEVYTEDQLN